MPATDPGSLSVPEMLRIMDVATDLRQDRELVEEQLNLDALKEKLRARMIAAAKVTGEEVTPEEVDAAIHQYYASLHTFREPRLTFPVFLAHLWVRRVALLWVGWAAILAISLLWWLYLAPNGRLTTRGRIHREAERLAGEVQARGETLRAIALDPKVVPEVNRLVAEAAIYRQKDDPKGLGSVLDALTNLEARLREEYAITVVSGAGRKSAIDRYFTDQQGKRMSGFYAIVEARRPDGSVVPRRVRNGEKDEYMEVTTWGERVPVEVYNRLKKDKTEDGVLNETAFAAKRRGFADEEVTMPGPDGKPLVRSGQITKW